LLSISLNEKAAHAQMSRQAKSVSGWITAWGNHRETSGTRIRASRRRKAFRCACRWKVDCVRGAAKGDTRVRGEFDVVVAARDVRWR